MQFFLTEDLGNFDVFSIVRIILIVYGAYSVYTAKKMAQDGQPPQWLLSAQELPRVKDTKGFCTFMMIPTMVFGFACMGYGLLGMFVEYYLKNSKIQMIVLLAFLAVVIWFVTRLQKAKKDYIR
ncbi:hypothetical protein [Eubacterium oxidoreducens]|uniref:Uncharacterized protein n=1 Tax=Eubacterium oxidoreducens TaxID=1732 RepID=A0A1G6C8M3_EUBOX|nr:hypothetical protein [Eubacterium oxidoreducens]SDB29191.1 hypothetical protein SAMN02910417_02185 [Eubacterium oxidoreducens]